MGFKDDSQLKNNNFLQMVLQWAKRKKGETEESVCECVCVEGRGGGRNKGRSKPTH